MTDVADLWSPLEGRPIFRAVMSEKRFVFFLRCLRLDNYRTREERQINDRLAAVSDIWNQFLANLRRHHVPGSALTVDEQLVSYRGRIPGRTYLPSKPGKYGLKIFWLAEAGSGFALNAKIYTGRIRDGPPERNLGENVVMMLTEPYYHTGRDIITDNYFTSHCLATPLLEKGLTLLGTIRAHRREIPTELRNKHRPVGSTVCAYDHQNKIVLLSFIPKRNKNVLLLSSSHSGNEAERVDSNQKPTLIMDYNAGKGGVDQLDQNVNEYTCRRKTVRWPLIVLYNIFDVAAFDAFLLMKSDNPNLERKLFLRELCTQLVETHARIRHSRNARLPQAVKNAGLLLGFREGHEHPQTRSNVNRIQHCSKCHRSTRSKCEECNEPICPAHRIMLKICMCESCSGLY